MTVIQLQTTYYHGHKIRRTPDGRYEVRDVDNARRVLYVCKSEDEAKRWIDEQFGNGGPEAA